MNQLVWLFISVVIWQFYGIFLKGEIVENAQRILENANGTVDNKTGYGGGSINSSKIYNNTNIKNGFNPEEKYGQGNDSNNNVQNGTKPTEDIAFYSNKSISNATYDTRNFSKKGSVSNAYKLPVLRKHHKSKRRKHASHSHGKFFFPLCFVIKFPFDLFKN